MTEASVWTRAALNTLYKTEWEIRGLQSDKSERSMMQSCQDKETLAAASSAKSKTPLTPRLTHSVKFPSTETMWNLICCTAKKWLWWQDRQQENGEKLAERDGKNKGGELIKEEVAGESRKQRNRVRGLYLSGWTHVCLDMLVELQSLSFLSKHWPTLCHHESCTFNQKQRQQNISWRANSEGKRERVSQE